MFNQTTMIDFHVCDACNLDCVYCYLKGSARKYDKYMNIDSFNLFFNKFTQSKDKKEDIFISFWGGEPLLNFTIIKHIVKRFDSYKGEIFGDIKFVIVTNGTLVNIDIAKFCKDNNVRLVITLDGDKKCHNRQRLYKNNKGTFDNILKNIKILQNMKTPYAVRTTLTANSPLPSVIIKELKKNGIKGSFFTPVTPITLGDYKNLSSINSKKIVDNLFDTFLTDFEQGNEFIYKNINLAIRVFFSKNPIKTCGICAKQIAVKYDNTIYPCHRMVFSKEQCLGNINNEIDFKFAEYYDSIFENNKKCNNCEYRYFCGGFCRMEVLRNCNLQHIQTEWCLYIKSLLHKTFKLIIYYYLHDISKYKKLTSLFYDKEIRLVKINKKVNTMNKYDIPQKEITSKSIDLDEEGLIYREDVFDLRYIANITTMAIWDLIDGCRTSEHIATNIASACDIELEKIEDDIYNQLQILKDLGLINLKT